MTNHLNWHHIMDKQPGHGEMIVQCDPPYECHYTMGMRRYYQPHPWRYHLAWCKQYEWPLPDFYWILAKDFPFPVPVAKPMRGCAE